MSDNKSLVHIGDISKPVTVLIEKISNAIGIVYEPKRIVNKAKAEAEAKKIKTLSKIELDDLEQRTFQRVLQQEIRKQENIEQITAKAIESLDSNANVESLEEDWVAYFFKQCDTVSDEAMQSLWSKLLSGEASNPGTFSKRTVDFVSRLDKKDAELFTTFCQFNWVSEEISPLIYDFKHDVYIKQGIKFSSLLHLQSLGLISLEGLTTYDSKVETKQVNFYYYGRRVTLEFPSETNNIFARGHVILSSIGTELAPICGSVENSEFYDYITDKWRKEGLLKDNA